MKKLTITATKYLSWIGALLILCLQINSAAALSFMIRPNDDLVGKVYTVLSEPGDNFDKIARRYDVGFYELIEANPTINPLAVKPYEKVIIPARFILPTPHEGIILNIAQMRIFHFLPNSNEVLTFPVGIGRQGEQTPTGRFYILTKEARPQWHAPDSVRKMYLEQGITIPPVVPAGPANPLGNYAMRLNIWSTLIHGTNEPDSVGKRSSAGCVHLYPEDIYHLFSLTELKTPVRIIDTIYKLGWRGNDLYLAVDSPLSEDKTRDDSDPALLTQAVKQAIGKRKHVKVDWALARRLAQQRTGIPTKIGTV